MADLPGNTYDEVPYESKPFCQTHPDRLASVATLLGLTPAEPRRCRVLELGCAAGGNLIPLASSLPESKFLGVDLSNRQIADGQAVVKQLGLTNIELRHQSILDVNPETGLFDFIICHGVYSWVPAAVQDKILAICSENLAPNGVAYVSYNTLPGWHMRGMIRDMMRYHANRFADAELRVQQARNLLNFLAQSVSQDGTPYSLLLKNEVDLLAECEDSYLFHEHLEECNEPIYFHEFVQRAAGKGLRYLAEADFHVMAPGNYPAEIERTLHQISPDVIHLEQFMDFLRNRMFRQTLLCHQEKMPSYGLRPETLRVFSIASSARPTAEQPDLHTPAAEEFCNLAGIKVTVQAPIAKMALVTLAECWPQPMPFDKLAERARARLTPDQPTVQPSDIHDLGHMVLSCYLSASSRLLELWLTPPPMTLEVSDKPATNRLALLQAAKGRRVVNQRHELVELDNFGRHIVALLDGTRDRAALVEQLLDRVNQGQLNVREDEVPVKDQDRLRLILGEALTHMLPRIGRLGLLVP